ncbi:MAG: hypothetical protein V4732_09120 [Pseudomonadota bacterium]
MNTVNIPRLLQKNTFLLLLISFSLLTACGGDDKKSNASSSMSSHVFVPTPVTPTGAGIWPDIKVSASGTKTLKFEWTDASVPSGTTYYKLLKKTASNGAYDQIGVNFTGLSVVDPTSVHLTDWVNSRYKVQACGETACVDSAEIVTDNAMLSAITYIKASNAQTDDWFGWSIAISGDGNTLAVGAPAENSKSIGVNGEQNNEDSPNSGAVYIFIKNEAGVWQQEAYLKASNTEQPNEGTDLTFLSNDRFGYQVALSTDGNTLAVSALLEDSPSTGINCSQDDFEDTINGVRRHASFDTGAVYIFKRAETVWTQNTYVKAMDLAPGAQFGLALAISGDGKTLAVGTPQDYTDYAGVFVQSSSSSSTECFSYNAFNFSSNSSTSSNSSNSSNSSAISSNAAISVSNSSIALPGGSNSGAVHIFKESDTGWTQEAFLKASDANPKDNFGVSLSLSQDGNTLAVGATGEDSKDATSTNDTITLGNYRYYLDNGGVYIFSRDTSHWAEQIKVKPSYSEWIQQFGFSVALSGDGKTLAVGAPGDWSKSGTANDYNIATDLLDNPANPSPSYGAAYTFIKTESTWSQQASYIKASTPHIGDHFGSCVALSYSGNILAVGSPFESSLAKGINDDQKDTSSALSGAAYVFVLTGNSWVQKSYVKAPNSDKNDRFGHALGLDASGETLMIGAHRESSNAQGVNGDRANNAATASGAIYLY